MAKQVYTLRDIPKYETIRAVAAEYPELDPASAAVYLLLVRTTSDVLAQIDGYLEQHGMSRGRWTVLMLLYHSGQLAQNPCDLARKAGVTRATMTGLLDGLERAQLAARVTADDRRMLEVRLTAEGRRFLQRVMPGYFRLLRRLMGGLSEREKQAMLGLLEKLAATAGLNGQEPDAAMSAGTR